MSELERSKKGVVSLSPSHTPETHTDQKICKKNYEKEKNKTHSNTAPKSNPSSRHHISLSVQMLLSGESDIDTLLLLLCDSLVL